MTSERSKEVVFRDFKASPEPSGPPPDCIACDEPLVWRPGRYSFTFGSVTFTVRQMGWYKCLNGHPGQVFLEDFLAYAQKVEDYQARKIHKI